MDDETKLSGTPTADAVEKFLRDQKTAGNETLIKSSRELYKFLLGDTDLPQALTDEQLRLLIEIITTGSDSTPEDNHEEVQILRDKAKRKFESYVKEHKLGSEDKIALEQLYIGFTQAELLEKGKGYEVQITRSSTGISYYPFVSVSGGREKLKASLALWNIILEEFSQIRILDNSRQIRRSQKSLFGHTAILEYQVHNEPKVLAVMPIHKIEEAIGEFDIR